MGARAQAASVAGDLTDRGSLIAACEATDVVIVTATAMTARSKRGSDIPGIASSSRPERKEGVSDMLLKMGPRRTPSKP